MICRFAREGDVAPGLDFFLYVARAKGMAVVGSGPLGFLSA